MKLRTALLPGALVATLLLAAPAATAAPLRPGQTEPSRGDHGVAYLVIDSFENIPAAGRAAFLAAAQQDGYDSLKHERGTQSFHVVPDPGNPSRLVVAMTFANRRAFEIHEHGRYEHRLRALAARDHATGPNRTISGTSRPLEMNGRRADSRGDAGVVFTVVAEFDNVQPQFRDEFIAMAQTDGYRSLTEEPGTLGYHFVPDPKDPTRVVFLETFTDQAAFDAHKNGPAATDFLALVARAHITGPSFFVTNRADGFSAPGGVSVPNQDG
ncbi:putative quinol monooxygenase [Kitasatospora sp. NPDC048540]|uniref:putative quinol monooxygenase n=1 Tax=unclassified Kitasatospora TaxID=2633591 RepID=UPI00068A192B|nr:putative quinol monooxygenase [Kitasatospora sp. MBT63]